jgi:bifunctional DNA-binding transcriptional regulator/antitoxin component of YhaV-PrlF toxin-antitoxin module
MASFLPMKSAKISAGGQISIPSAIRRRWATSRLTLEDLGDRIVLTPAPDDPIAAARGALVAPLAEEPRSESCVAENVQQEAVAAKRV